LALLLVLVLLGAVILDASRAPDRQVTAALAVRAIHAYQHTASPVLSRIGFACRFTPTCSHYAETSLRKHGIVAGGWRALKRVARCGPWTPLGTKDPAD